MKPEEIDCDVLVVGAGVSGIAAAVAAAKRGARTILLEENDFPGGTVIAGMHRYLCGLYGMQTQKSAVPGSDRQFLLNDGIVRGIIRGLRKRSLCNRPLLMGRVRVFAFRDKDLRACLSSLLKQGRNLEVLFNSRAYAVKKEKGLIREVRVKTADGILAVRPKVVVDASGEGAIIKVSGAAQPAVALRKRQLAGLSFRVKGVRDPQGLLAIKVPYYLKFATYTALDSRGEGVVRLNYFPAVRKAFDHLRKKLTEFRKARIVPVSPYITRREGLRLRGEYILTAGDIMRGRKFKDGVVKNAWPIEIWDREKGPRYRYMYSSYYEIPVRCLKSKNIGNLLAAGRCISVTREAFGSTRAAGTCIALGEQAGIAAVKLCESY